MAYCPKCRRVVEEKWIECPVCRTNVVPDEKYARKEEAKTLNKPPGWEARREYGFFDRLVGVLKFDRQVIDSMAVRQPMMEVLALIAASNLIYWLIPASPYAVYFGMDFLTRPYFIVLALKLLVTSVVVLAAAAAIHFAVKVFGGHEGYATTILVMLYVAAEWSIVMNIASLILELAGTLLYGPSMAALSVDLVTLAFVFVVFVGWVVAFAVVHGMSTTMALISVVAGLGLFSAMLAGASMALSAVLEIITSLPNG